MFARVRFSDFDSVRRRLRKVLRRGVKRATRLAIPALQYLPIICENEEIVRSVFYDNVRDWQGYNDVNNEIRTTLRWQDFYEAYRYDLGSSAPAFEIRVCWATSTPIQPSRLRSTS